jgi:small subunit ribosomal protein S6
MRSYQLVLVLRTALKDADRKKFVEAVKDWLKGAKFTKEEEWGEKALAYAVKKEKAGFFYNFIFETKQDSIKDLEKRLMASDNVLRQLIVKVK